MSVDGWDNQIDANISVAHAMPAVNNQSGLNESEELAYALGLRGEISKVYGTLGSANVGSLEGARSIFFSCGTCFHANLND